MTQINFLTSALPPSMVHETQIPSFLKSAKKAAQLVLATFVTLIATGLFAIGVTMTPFALEAGMGAIALSTGLFGTAAYLFNKACSKPQTKP